MADLQLDPREVRQPGGYAVQHLRDFYVAIGDNLSELKQISDVDKLTKVATDAKGCFCAASSCQQACPKGKDVPRIMELLRNVDFEVLTKEFGGIMEKLDAYLEQHKDKTLEEYYNHARKGYIKYLNELVSKQPTAFQKEYAKLTDAIKEQFRTTMQAEFTGMACPAPCEGADTTGCTLLTQKFGAAKIKSVERNLAELAVALGVVDEMWGAIGSAKKRQARVDIVGAGPAGLQMAEEMTKLGFETHLWDEKNEIGGVMNEGVPPHKIPKDRFAIHRHLMETKGRVTMHLGHRVTKADRLHEVSDLVIYAGGVMDGKQETFPTWVSGWGRIKDNPRVMAAYDPICEGTRLANEGKKRKAPNLAVLVGAGDTSEDYTRRTARDADKKYIENGYEEIIGINSESHLIRIDRNPMPTDSELRGQGYGKTVTTNAATPLTREMGAMGYNTIYGAELHEFDEQKNGEIKIVLKFRKPIDEKLGIDKSHLTKSDYEQDFEVGAIKDENEKVIGLRMRDATGKLHDFEAIDAAKMKFANIAKEGGIVGDVDGHLTIKNCDELAFAMGAPKTAYKSEFLGTEGLVEDRHVKINKNNGAAQADNRYVMVVGDASGADQLIVHAQADATRKTNVAAYHLNAIAEIREKGAEVTKQDKKDIWKETQHIQAKMPYQKEVGYNKFLVAMEEAARIK